jgi:hypothetical protein
VLVRRRIMLAMVMVVAACVFFTGLKWGLPSRDVDSFLFGDHRAWSGTEIQRLAGERRDDPSLGANVPQHLLAGRDQVIALNETDEQRAQIIRRYRLYSYQPDENTLLMALARMKPGKGDLDPKFYQYGGLFVYPVGIALKLAAMCHWTDLRGDVAWYIDHPEAFGRFYVVARATAALWGLAGVWAVFWIARRLGGSDWAAGAAGLGYAFLPVVVNGAHEAKPHLPGAVLMLCAIIAACRYVETSARKYLIATGALCGAAFAMVLSALWGFAVIPAMVLMSRQSWRRRIGVCLSAGALGIAVYFCTNPYVAINLVGNRELLRSNLTNSTDMYRAGGWRSGVPNAVMLIGEGATPGMAVAGVAAVVGGMVLAVRRRRVGSEPPGGRFVLGVLLAVVAAPVLAQYLSLAAGKPAEYGRFATFLDIALVIAAVSAIAAWARHAFVSSAIISLLLAATMLRGLDYLYGFIADSGKVRSRIEAAQWIDATNMLDGRVTTMYAVWAEPAPYVMPPVNLFRDRLLLLPKGYEPRAGQWPADVMMKAEDAPPREAQTWTRGAERIVVGRRGTRISWAAKPIVIVDVPK